MDIGRITHKETFSADFGLLECSCSTQEQLRQYAEDAGVSVSSIVDEALLDWMTCVGPARRPLQYRKKFSGVSSPSFVSI